MGIQEAFSWRHYPGSMKDPIRSPFMLPLLLSTLHVAGYAIEPALATTATAGDPESAEQLLTRGGMTPPEPLSLMRSVAQAQSERKDYPNARSTGRWSAS
jgi:hypothetical protein